MTEEEWESLDADEVRAHYAELYERYLEVVDMGTSFEGNAGTLIQAMFQLSARLATGNQFGHRREAMEFVMTALSSIALQAHMAMPSALISARESVEEEQTESEFDKIVSGLESDPDFNKDAE